MTSSDPGNISAFAGVQSTDGVSIRHGRSMIVYPERWEKTRKGDGRAQGIGDLLKHRLSILAGFVALGFSAACAFGQAEQPSAAEKKSATTIVLPPSPKALLPDGFDGW